MGRAEVEFPLSSKMRSLGLRPSAFVDIGSVWGLKTPNLDQFPRHLHRARRFADADDPPRSGVVDPDRRPAGSATRPTASRASTGFQELFLGNSPKPRLSVGIGVNWISPFGPLRIDLAKALLKQEGDDTKLFSFNVGTQF